MTQALDHRGWPYGRHAVPALWLASLLAAGALCRAADSQALTAAYNHSAAEILCQVVDDDGNALVSPISLGTAMAMTLAGARTDTEAEMARVLHHGAGRRELAQLNQALVDRLERLDRHDTTVLRMANALCVTGVGVAPSFSTMLRDVYGAELFSAGGVGPINAWVAKRTEGKIDKILESLSANSVCVLLNALYFKALWASPFRAEGTVEADFMTADGATVRVPMMGDRRRLEVREHAGWRVGVFPYEHPDLCFMAALPPEGAAPGDATPEQTVSLFGSDGRRNAERRVVAMPRFKLSAKESLKEPFIALGMELAFDGRQGDFGGMAGRDSAPGLLWIAQIQHATVFEVDEKGSEGAAATAVEMQTRSMPRYAEPFRLDRSFLFAAVDRDSGAMLFLGALGDPSKK